MREIEWDDDEHHLAEAEHSVYGKVVMMELDGTGDIVVLMDEGLLSAPPSALTPTGRKLRLIPDESVPKGGPIETDDDHAPPAPEPAAPRPEDVPVGEPWQVAVEGRQAIGFRDDSDDMWEWTVSFSDGTGGLWVNDSDVTLIARLVPETTEQDSEQEFDPAYTYRDKDGDKWLHQDGAWRWASGMAGKVSESGHYKVPPAEYGPYTRIEAGQ